MSRREFSRRAAELLLLRIREREETFGLPCVVSSICRVRPLWPSAPRIGNLPCNGGRPPNPAYLRPARGSECTRRAYFRAQRATASISREESWKVAAKKVYVWKAAAKIFMHLLCDLGGLARKSISRKLLSSKGRRPLSALSASHTYHLCGSISSAALREKSDNQEQHWVSTKK